MESLQDFRISGHDLSPIKHIYLKSESFSVEEKNAHLQKIADYCADNGITLSVATYLRDSEVNCPEPSIRLASNSTLTDEKIDKLVTLLNKGYLSLKI